MLAWQKNTSNLFHEKTKQDQTDIKVSLITLYHISPIFNYIKTYSYNDATLYFIFI